MTETRKIAAILAADVVGYCRLASADKDRILARLRGAGSDLIDPTIAIQIFWLASKVPVRRPSCEQESVHA
jgi:hypothetical protein